MTIACANWVTMSKTFASSHKVDLVICGNHNHSLFSRATCSAKNIVGSCGVDVLLVSLERATPVSPFPELGQFREGGYLPPQAALLAARRNMLQIVDKARLPVMNIIFSDHIQHRGMTGNTFRQRHA